MNFDKPNSSQTTRWSWPLLGVAPACLWGACIMVLHRAPWSMPITNIVAALLGLLGVGLLSPSLISLVLKRPFVVAVFVLATMSATLLDAGLDGVHRWVRLGPIRLHPAALATPLLLLTIVIAWERRKAALTIILIAAGLALHIAQPDAGQATAFAAGAILLAAIPDKRIVARLSLVILASLGAFTAWTRPDPLLGVAMVEDIVPRAFAMHAGLGIVAVITLVMLPGAAIGIAQQSKTNRLRRLYGLTLAAYFAASIIVVAIGEFPTPVLGFGASPIWGALWGLGLLERIQDPGVHEQTST